MKRCAALVGLVWAAFAVAGVAPAAAPPSPIQEEGRRLFELACVHCHGGERTPGVIMLSRRIGPDKARIQERTDLNAVYVRLVVRRGIGGMAHYRKTELSDRELDAIAAYLTRNQKRPADAP